MYACTVTGGAAATAVVINMMDSKTTLPVSKVFCVFRTHWCVIKRPDDMLETGKENKNPFYLFGIFSDRRKGGRHED